MSYLFLSAAGLGCGVYMCMNPMKTLDFVIRTKHKIQKFVNISFDLINSLLDNNCDNVEEYLSEDELISINIYFKT